MVCDGATGRADTAGFAVAVGVTAAGLAGVDRLTVGEGLAVAGAVATGFAVVVGVAAAEGFGVAAAAVAGLLEPAGFAELAVADGFALPAGEPTAVVRARVTFGFGLAAAWPEVAGLAVGSGGVVGSAMRLA